jgi:hypothetical protein
VLGTPKKSKNKTCVQPSQKWGKYELLLCLLHEFVVNFVSLAVCPEFLEFLGGV